MTSTVQDLIDRSHSLGGDPKYTNYAGGNTSAKGALLDPVTGESLSIMWAKGSGGDLATLTEAGITTFRLDRLRALEYSYPGPEREDEMVAAFDYCLHGKGGAAPSIDTAMHGLVDAPHVDHLHPDAGIAIATSADGEKLTKEIYGGKVLWVPWRRPGFQLGLDIAHLQRENPEVVGVILQSHGITAWGATSEESETNARWIIDMAANFIDSKPASQLFGGTREGFITLARDQRRERAAALAPTLRRIASRDRAVVGHFTDIETVLNFVGSMDAERLAGLGTSCPDHFLRTKIRPLYLDLPASASIEECAARLAELHEEYRANYAAYYEKYATVDSPAMRGADPAIILVPGVGMFSYGKDKQTARVAGEFYINSINIMAGAEAISSYSPIGDEEKFRIEYWALEEAKLQRMPAPKSHATRIALVTGAASGIGKAIANRLANDGACVVVADLDLKKAEAAAAGLGDSDIAIGLAVDVTDADSIARGVRDAVLAFGGIDIIVNNAGVSLSKSLLETTEGDWDIQHDIMAKGSFLVSRACAPVLIEQEMGGDVIYIVSKNSVFAGPNNVAYAASKADQAHQVRLLAAELGEHGVKVNGINPDGVVSGSGIFAGAWGSNRAKTYGVAEEDLGKFYAQRTILKREVLPENVANAVSALTGPDFSHTTGLHVPVDGGVAVAFLR
ncbi:MAG TPA: bifunctional aldolase/short-chain dehydrogenase [Nocardioidaceae bacterium]|nr:bifunctional aldolase/short-chain dehydrogenase [Nocardioidaceae bacterium]